MCYRHPILQFDKLGGLWYVFLTIEKSLWERVKIAGGLTQEGEMYVYGLSVKIQMPMMGPTYTGPRVLLHEKEFSEEEFQSLANEAAAAVAGFEHSNYQRAVSYLVEEHGFVAPDVTIAVVEWP